MPVRSHGKLLAGIGALLGVCAAGSGCQSQSMRQGPFADSSAVMQHPIASSKPDDEPRLVPTEPGSESIFNGPIVKMLRPTPHAAAPIGQDSVLTSSWRPMTAGSSDALVRGEPGPVEPMQAPTGAIVQVRNAGDVPPTRREPPLLAQPQPQPQPQPTVHHVEAEVRVAPTSFFHPARPIAALPVPREFDKQPLPPYVIEPPDILLIRASRAITLPTQPMDGQHLVKMDGNVNLGIYGEVFLAGRTVEQARDAVAAALLARRVKGKDPKDLTNPMAKDTELTVEDIKRELQVDVLAYNSKFYFIIIDGGGYGERVFRLPFTGNETVLDAMSQIGGLPEVSSRKNMWIARATPADCDHPNILPIDWRGITRLASARTNYQVFPGDRIFVKADLLLATNNAIGKVLAPVEKLLGVTLLGSSTVNSIKNGGNGTNGGTP